MIRQRLFDTTPEGKPVTLYTISNEAGMEADVLDWGAVLWRVRVPDRSGSIRDAALYLDTLQQIREDGCYLGACVGPHGNRIGGASFELNGETCALEVNDGVNNLHSGSTVFFRKLWTAEPLEEENAVALRLEVPDGEGGFPGNRKIEVVYRLTEDCMVEIGYRAESDRDTVMNMTNHSYFNFGDFRDPILTTELRIDADYVTEVGDGLIPTGRLLPVEGTVFDFRQARLIGERQFCFGDEQLALGAGYDHNYVLNGSGWRCAAEAYLPLTGISMEVWTDQPGMQFYAGNFLAAPYGKYRGFALETQHYPDSVHHDNFPSVILKAGETYCTKTGYRFSVR